MEGKISSERHLQAELYHILCSDEAYMAKYQLHVEPNLHMAGRGNKATSIIGIIPDMLVTEGNNIIAHVELKYVPYDFIRYQKDILNFRRLYSYRGTDIRVLLMVNPLNGDWDNGKEFTFDSDMIFIYAVITNSESDFIRHGDNIWKESESEMNITPGYLFLLGTTNEESPPEFRILTNIPAHK